ncbi:hypothetical protein [Sphingomonas sp.]|uniref:hypothetical protein n=1 Tax=Sphingomonas sp. TaxID=28214 RepID=UPI003B3B2BC2
MAEVVDSIIAELIARDQGYVETFDRATAAHGRFKASIDKLKVQTFDLGAEGRKYKAGVADMAQAEEQSSARMTRAKKAVSDADRAAAAAAKAAAKEKADAERASARAVAEAAKAEQKAKEAAERAAAKATAAAQREAEKRAAAAKVAADAVVAAAAREEAARTRIAAMVDRSLTSGGIQPGTGANFGRVIPAGGSKIPNSPVAPAATEDVAVEKEINHLLADRFDLQARVRVLQGDEKRELQDQISYLARINAYKRAGLSDDQATLRAEAEIAAIEVARARNVGRTAGGKSGLGQFAGGATLGYNPGLGAGAGIATAGAVAVTIALAKSGLDYAQSLKQQSDQLGLTTHDLQVYQTAAQQAGVTTEQFRESVGQLAGNLGRAQQGGEEQQKLFAALNIDVGNARDGYKSLSDILPTIVDRLSKIPDQARRFAIETALGGEQLRRLDPILSGGTASFEALAASIEKTGGLLSDEQIQNADQTARKLELLGNQLQRDIAGTVANNAGAIETLATAFFHAAEGALKFFSAMTNRGNLDILNSSGLTNFASGLLGNDPNKTRSQAFSDLLGNAEGRRALAQRNAAALNELNRIDQIRKVNAAGLSASSSGGVTTLSGGSAIRANLNTAIPGLENVADTASGRYAAYVRLNAERQRILAADRASKAQSGVTAPQPGSPGDTSNLFAPKPPKRKSAQSLENERLQRERQYNDQLARLQEDELRAKEQQTGDINAQAEIERQLLERSYQRQLDDIRLEQERNVNRGADAKLEEARATQLKAAAKAAHDAELAGIEQTRQVGVLQAQTQHLQTTLDIDADLLSSRLSLARTAAKRRDIELQLLENARRQKEAQLDGVINNPRSSPDEVQDAKARRAALPGQTAAERENIERRDAGPLKQYLDTLPRTAQEVNEAVEQAAANGLTNLNDKLAETVGQFLKLHGIAGQFVQDLIKIGLQRAALSIFSSATGGGGGILSAIGKAFGVRGARAAGGNVVAGVPYVVGEHRAEVFVPPVSGSISPNTAVKGGGGSGAMTVKHVIAVEPSPMFVTSVREQAQGAAITVVAQIAPSIVQASKTATLTSAARPGLPRGVG